MVRIETKEDLEKWLEDKPREWAVAIASRAAMRVLPDLGHSIRELQKLDDWEYGIVLAVFRRLRIAHSALLVGRGFDLKSISGTLLRPSKYSGQLEFEIYNVKTAAEMSSYCLISEFPNITASSALPMSGSGVNLSEELIQDVLDLENRELIWELPLWGGKGHNNRSFPVDGNAVVSHNVRLNDWPGLRAALLTFGPYWQTLIQWYEDRLIGDEAAAQAGRPALREMEIEIALLPNKVWEDARRANEAIREIQERHWKAWREAHESKAEDVISIPRAVTRMEQKPPPKARAKPKASKPKTAIGKAVVQNQTVILLQSAAIHQLVESRIAELEQQKPNSEEAIEARDSDIAELRDWQERVLAIGKIAQDFEPERDEKEIINLVHELKKAIQIAIQKHGPDFFNNGARGLIITLLMAMGHSCGLAFDDKIAAIVLGLAVGGQPVLDGLRAVKFKLWK